MQDSWKGWRSARVPTQTPVADLQIYTCLMCDVPFLLTNHPDQGFPDAVLVATLSRLAQLAILPLWCVVCGAGKPFQIMRIHPKKAPLTVHSAEEVDALIEEFRRTAHLCGRREMVQ